MARITLWSCGCGIAILIAAVALTYSDSVQPVAGALLLPGPIAIAKLLGAPCAASHTVDCAFWAIDVQILNPYAALLLAGFLVDWLLYASLILFSWQLARRLQRRTASKSPA